jgi:phenylpyruvate tautomerase
MPVLRITTNVTVSAADKQEVLKAASRLAAKELGKPESYVMVGVSDGAALLFGGTDQPAAFVELFSLGLPEDLAPRLSAMVSGLLKESLGIDPRRVYLKMSDHPANLWGWNGATF